MKEFTNFDAFSKHLEKITSQYQRRELKTFSVIGELLEEKAKETIGHLQDGAGQFESWAPLAESTKADKEKKGYVFNEEYNPLLRTGELRNSISHSVRQLEHEVILGSDSDIMIYQEFGTIRIPPRSVIGLTLFKEKEQIQFILGMFLLNWITNKALTTERKP